MICFVMLLYSCTPVTETERKTETEKTEKPIEKVVKNVDAVARNYIKSENIKSIEKIGFDYDLNGNLFNQEKISTVNYNASGLPEETIIYDDKSKIESKFNYKYDSTGRRTETIKYSSEGKPENKYTYEYNKYGNKIKSTRYDLKGNMEKYYLYDYDDYGNLIEERWFNAGDNLEYKIEYEYTEDGKKKSVYSYNSDNDLLYKYEFKYDKKGNIIEEEKFDNNDKKVGIIQYVYKYF